jgi:phosphohistidine phosphatase
MKLYLVQHAEAKAKEDDPQRPLSERGLADSRKVAAFLARKETAKVSHILHSGKLRAEQTAKILAEELQPGSVTATDGMNPLDDPSIWIARLIETNEDLMMVGHLPHLEKLVAQLVAGDAQQSIVRFQVGGVVYLKRQADDCWVVGWMVVPGIIP